jgi:hypothetical protein
VKSAGHAPPQQPPTNELGLIGKSRQSGQNEHFEVLRGLREIASADWAADVSQAFDEFDNLGKSWFMVDMLAVDVSRKTISVVDLLCNLFVLKCLSFMEQMNGIEPS